MTGSVYSSLVHRLHDYEGETYPFHIGDTWMEPAVGTRMEDLTVEQFPGMHRYAPVQGRRDLLEAIADRTLARTGVPTEPRDILVTAGATGALGAIIGAITEPGDEVLLLAPYWPLISGIVRSSHATAVDVPILGAADSPETVIDIVKSHRTDRTVAVYWNSPNNPTGRVMPRSWIEALVEWAVAENLWILPDEVYEDYVFEGEHAYGRPLAPDRTFSVHSCSKAFGMAGNRCGYAIGPPGLMANVRKVSTHTFYSTPTASQIAARRALAGPGDAWVADARAKYAEVGRRAAARLGLEAPEGSTFLWLDIAEQLAQYTASSDQLMTFLSACVEHGILLAPGLSFGPYPTHIRLCYTAVEPEVTDRGIDALARLLGR
ncbi:MAG: pyridoxal phosphate-dependent aminotransferase [Thermoanaerobaculia bacterium]